MGRTLPIHAILEDPIQAVELENLDDFDALKARLERNDLPLVEPVAFSRLSSVHRTYIPKWMFDEASKSWDTRTKDQSGTFVALGMLQLCIAAACFLAGAISGRFDPFGPFAFVAYVTLLGGVVTIGISKLPQLKTFVAIEGSNRILVSRIVGHNRTDSLPIPPHKAALLLTRAALPGTIKGTIDYRYLLVLIADNEPAAILATHWSLARVLRVKDETPEPLRSSPLYAITDFNLKVRCRRNGEHRRTGPILRGAARVSGITVPSKAARDR